MACCYTQDQYIAQPEKRRIWMEGDVGMNWEEKNGGNYSQDILDEKRIHF